MGWAETGGTWSWRLVVEELEEDDRPTPKDRDRNLGSWRPCHDPRSLTTMRLVTLKQAAAWYWWNSRMESVTTLKDSVGNLRSWRPCDYPKSLKTCA